MATLFQSIPGQVVALSNVDGDKGMPLTVDGMSGSWFPRFRSIISEMHVGLDGNYQLTHTCEDVVYVYAFGDRISQMQIGGVAFTSACAGSNMTGIEQVLAWYKKNRIAVRSKPIQVQIGSSASGLFRGYLTNLVGDIIKAESRLSQFALLFKVFPGG